MDSLSLQFITTLLLGFFALLCIYYLVRKRKGNKLNEPAQPDGAWPIIGHLHLLARGELPQRVFGALADKYGPILMLRLGKHKALVITDAEIVKECFTTNDRFLGNRPSGTGSEILGYNYAMFAVAPYGPYWSELRKIIRMEVLSIPQLESLKHVWQSEISLTTKELYQFWENQMKTHGKVLVDMKHWFGNMTLNIAVRMVVGKRYFGLNGDEKEGMRCKKAFRNFFRLAGAFVMKDFLPFPGWLDLQGYHKEMKETAREIDAIAQIWLDEHKSKTKSGVPEEEKDFMHVMLSLLDESKLKFSGFDIDIINKTTCFSLVIGGADTLGGVLTWALSLLLNNPPTLKKAQDELDFHIGKDQFVDESDLKKLTYIDAIIKEALRLHPPSPLLGPREVTEDCTIAGYDIRAGTRIFVNAWKIQRDPSIWSNPSEFQPERFLDKDIDMKGRYFEFIPFGSGRRACPGMFFSLHVLPLALARLLHGFDYATPTQSKVDMTESAGIVNAKENPLEVHITPRMSPKFYE